MSFFKEFCHVLLWRPIQALEALFWYLARRKVRARNRLRRDAHKMPHFYKLWMMEVEQGREVVAGANAVISKWPSRPSFSVIMLPAAPGGLASMADAMRSVEGQCYTEWEIISCLPEGEAAPLAVDGGQRRIRIDAENSADALNIAIDAARGDFLLPLTTDSRLPPTALFRYAQALQGNPHNQILFGDHDQIDSTGKRSNPWFKPLWNRELFLAQDYLSAACALRADLARALPSIDPDLSDCAVYALLLSAVGASADAITHVPHILCHTSRTEGPENQAARLQAVAVHLTGTGATVRDGRFGTIEIDWPLPQPLPLVSIIIPTRDKQNILQQCIDSVLASTSYPNFELIIVDNGSVERETIDYFGRIARDPRIRVVGYDGPFNYSAINNAAVRLAAGDYVCLLNNDTEVIAPDWLTALMRQAVRADSGAVGAKLLYSDGSIQHAGVVIGMGGAAGHAHRFELDELSGYFGQSHAQRWASAVTAACLVVEKSKFEAVNGLDEDGLAVAFNDVDFCLKLGKMGWHNIYEPRAILYHHESQSRADDMAAGQIERYRRELHLLQTRWATASYVDPAHHPALDRSTEAYFPRV